MVRYGPTAALYGINKTLIEGSDALDTTVRIMDMSRIGSVLTGDRSELGDGPPVLAMLIQNQNPLTVCPDSNRVRRGFARDDLFVATHEQFLTETARWSDIVLPATMFMEHDDLYQAGGHSHIQIGPKLIEPPGECRSNHDLTRELARRLGAEHPGFEMSAMEMIDATLLASGYPDAATMQERRWIDAAAAIPRRAFPGWFPDARQAVSFRPGLAGDGRPQRPDARPAGPHGQFRLRHRNGTVPPGDGAGAQLPQHQLFGNGLGPQARGPPDGAAASGRCRPPRPVGRLENPAGQ